MPILSWTGDILGAIGCSTGNSMQDEAAARAGRDAVLDLIQREKDDEECRIVQERQAVLSLWKEKEDEVETLKDQLDGVERGGKKMRLDGGSSGSGSESVSGSVPGRRGGVMRGGLPDTPPEEDDIHPSFRGEVAVVRY